MQPTFYDRTAPVAAKVIDLLPLAPPNALLALLVRRMVRRHKNILERLKPIAGTCFAIDITDLSLTVLLRVGMGTVTADFVRKAPKADVLIAGTLPVLIALLEGELDGDALFFTRDLTVSGDTEALLTLRNALDSGDFSLRGEIRALSGPLAPSFTRAAEALKNASHASTPSKPDTLHDQT